MEGEEHKAQRKLICPAFTAQAVKALSPIMFQKAEELRDRWDVMIQHSPSTSTSHVIDVCHWLSRATFDVIGLAGFDYHFNCLHDESEEMYLAYRRMFGIVDKGPGYIGLLRLYFPIMHKIWPDKDSRITRECQRVIHAAGKRLVENKKSAILAEKSSAEEIQEKDILSLLIKSNLSADSSKRMSDTGLLNQLSTFLFGGSDSTSLGMTWCLHHLSLHPEVQTRLREEILAAPSPTNYSATSHADVVDALPFLDAVVRETLRVSPPAHGSIRTAVTDDLIPVSHAVHMRDGTVVPPGGHIPIRKGSYIHIPIEGLNMSEEIWGEDAKVFNPDRWVNLPPTARNHPGLCNLMTFSFGPHSCPGYRFSILETKIFIATLVSHFVFKPSEQIRMSNAVVTRPFVTDRFELGCRLPMWVERYQH
jgi:cytochrome P450